MKRFLAGVLSVLLCAGTLTACSGSGKTASQTPASEAAGASSEASVDSGAEAAVPTDPVTLRVEWWGGDSRHEATLKAIDAFEAKYPYITIEPEYGGWDGMQEKVNTQMAGHTAPDVLQVNYDWLASLSKDGKGFYDLNSLGGIIDLSNWDDKTLKFGVRNGILNAIAISTTGRSLFYNKNTFDKLGVPIPKTWDDLLAAGKAFEAKGKNYYPLDLDTGSGFTSFYAAMAYEQQKTGKEFLTKDGEIGMTVDEFKDALDFYVSLEKSHVTRTQKQIQNDAGQTALYETNNFISGDVAGVLEWSSSIGKYQKVLKDKSMELVLGDLPVLDDAKMSGWFVKPSMLFAVNGETQYPKQSALFLNWFLNDPESAVILGTSRGIPASKSAIDALTKSNPDLAEDISYQATKQIEECDPTLESPYMDNAEMKKAYIAAVQAVSYETSTTQEAAQTLYDTMQSTLSDIIE